MIHPSVVSKTSYWKYLVLVPPVVGPIQCFIWNSEDRDSSEPGYSDYSFVTRVETSTVRSRSQIEVDNVCLLQDTTVF